MYRSVIIGFCLAGALATVSPCPAQEAGTFRPLTLSGRVLMDDGTVPPEPVVVELWCEGQRQPQEYTNREGKFNFRVGGDKSRAIADSQRSVPGQQVGATGSDRSFVSMTSCELQAALPGYTSTKIYLARRSVFESSDVGTLVLKRASKGEGTLISLNTASAPEGARKAFENGEKELAKKNPNRKKATAELQRAVGIYPQFASAWHRLGEARGAEGDMEGARQAFLKAIEADPKFASPYLAMALLELKQQRAAEAAKMAAKAVQLVPELTEAHYYNAIANMSLGNLDAAETSIRTVHAGGAAQRYPRTHFMLGNILAQKGKIQEAAVEFRAYLADEPSSQAAGAVRKQLEEWLAAGLAK